MNRCQSDVDSKMSHHVSREKEANYFASHPVYSEMPQNLFGIKSLISKLTRIQLMRIRPNMQEIVSEIRSKLAESE